MQPSSEVKPSIADLCSLDPAKREAARQEFVLLTFVDEQTGNCQRCAGNPPMRLYFRKTPVMPGPDHAWQTRVAEICGQCHRGSPTGGMWLNKERTKAVLRNHFHQELKAGAK